jgi:hypothetical protein
LGVEISELGGAETREKSHEWLDMRESEPSVMFFERIGREGSQLAREHFALNSS